MSDVGNMKNYMNFCPKLTMPHDPKQMLIDYALGPMSIRIHKFDPNMYNDLFSSALAMHDYSFQFVEYENIRKLYQYLEE